MHDNHGITAENLLRTLPDVLRSDANTHALASAVADELAARVGEIDRLRIYARIDELPEDLLDILAYDFKVDWWSYDYTLEEKRKTLKDSWAVHRMLGTKAAVETAISAVYANTKVKEWFEYGGEPYMFKLQIDATYENADPVKHQRVLKLVGFYKNLRSHLESVEYVAVPEGYCRSYAVVAAAGIGMEITVEVESYGVD
jgi:phage tail P2-like protein